MNLVTKASYRIPKIFESRLQVLSVLLAVLLIFLISPLSVYAIRTEAGTNCQWISLDELIRDLDWGALTGKGTRYVQNMNLVEHVNFVGNEDISLGYKYSPPLVRGDRDFAGHGPIYQGRVDIYLTPTLIYAEIWMRAEETQSDFTTVEGKSNRLILFDPWDFWLIDRVEAVHPGKSSASPPASTGNVYGQASFGKRLDPNGHAEEIIEGQNSPLILHMDVIGDIDGEDVGRTGIKIVTAITQIALCPNLSRGQQGVDLYGGDYYGFKLHASDPSLCQRACNSDDKCRAWTYLKPERSRDGIPACFLKNDIPRAIKNDCCVSGIR